MTNEEAIKILTELRSYEDKFAIIGFDRKEALDIAIKAIEQRGHVWEIAYERGKIDELNKRESEDNK